jgi:hypothetical protein
MSERKKIAAIITVYRPNSHADVVVTKFLKGFPTDEGLIPPRTDIASMYVDQFPENDLSRSLCAEYNIPLYGSIVEALTLGGKELAVDGVLLIGEHGTYAWNEKHQHLYPRKYFMEQICGVMATSGRAVPIFNDKHLSYNWHDAKWMYDRARQLGAPFMAGSSAVVGWRNPWLEIERDTPMTEAVAVGFSGLDIYGSHTLEVLQCMVERRAGGETGVAAVTYLEGQAVWDAGRRGLYSRELAEAACAPIRHKPAGGMEEHCKDPALFLIEYRDGFRGAILMLNGYVTDFGFACRTEKGVLATEIYLQNEPPFGHFSYLSLNVEEMFVTGVPSYPVERVLLTTGILEAALDSRHQGQVRLETPHLDVRYSTYDRVPWRPTGARPRT